jgi:hypothetical protein
MKSPTKSDLEKLCHHSQIYFAVFCAEQVFHLVEPKDQLVCRYAIDIAKLFIEGKATKEECYAAAYTAAAAYAAVDAAAYAAYAAADAAAYAANATEDRQAIIEAQWVYYNELLAFETIVEDVLLA